MALARMDSFALAPETNGHRRSNPEQQEQSQASTKYQDRRTTNLGSNRSIRSSVGYIPRGLIICAA